MASKFVDECAELGITKLLFVRHANANPITGESRSSAPHDWKFRDQTRTLSSKGREQCEQNKDVLSGLRITANLTSPARRASDTAVLMTLDSSTGGDVFLRMIESLHPAGMSAVCEDLFDNLGYGPLRKFFDAEDGQDAFLEYAHKVCRELSAKVGGPAFAGAAEGDTIGIFGHAVFLNAVAYAIADTLSLPDKDDILDVDLGEAEGLLIDIRGGSIRHLHPSHK